ncbi:MAG: hypothetical protein KDC98_02150, partial [Planctomycetes bacterium]|nr:hypothetical protein [Planctomycetota bacterium]
MNTQPTGAPNRILSDRVGDSVWVGAPDWKAEFTAAGATFVPFFGSDAPHNMPASFQLSGLRIAGADQPIEAVAPSLGDHLVTIERGSVREQYVLGMNGIEQQFLFETLPARGAIELAIGMTGDYAVGRTGAGHRLNCALGSFDYGAAIAIDGSGRRATLTTDWDGSAFRITVPQAFVAQATLPLLIDPLVGNVVSNRVRTSEVVSIDLAYDHALQRYFSVYEHRFSATDGDVYLIEMDSQMVNQVEMTIDFTTTDWADVHIADNAATGKLLTVAAVSSNGQRWIGGRTYDAAAASLGLQFDVYRTSYAAHSPDVGGERGTIAGGRFPVVFTREWSATDHDVLVQMVDLNSRVTSSVVIANSGGMEHSPAISRCAGIADAQQYWMIAFRRERLGVNETIAAKFTGAAAPAMAAIAAADSRTGPVPLDVSSPRLPMLGRDCAIVDQRIANLATAVHASLVSPNLVVTATQTVGNRITAPLIETDGYRFGIAGIYETWDWSFVRTVTVSNAQLVN